MTKANRRIQEIDKLLSKSCNDSDDDDLEDVEGLRAERDALQQSNGDHQRKLDHYEKHKKWNVDNMCHVVEERTIVNQNVGESPFSSTGFALPKDDDTQETSALATAVAAVEQLSLPTKDVSPPTTTVENASLQQQQHPPLPAPSPDKDAPTVMTPSMLTYHEFTQKYADTVETFMSLSSLDQSKEFLIQHGDVLLQENASNYLLLASLEDEMNGYHEKMKLVARQSQIISNIAELAKSLKRHPGNVILPFFARMEVKEMYDGFMEGVNAFIQRIEVRAVEKRKEMDKERQQEESVDVSEIPREERLGPGGLDPLEVFESLPLSMQKAFESREKSQLEEALLSMKPEEAEYHMKRCVDAGLWNA